MAAESKLERECMLWVRKNGGQHVKLRTKGWPDQCVVRANGTVFFCEFKAPGKVPSALQAHYLDLLNAMGAAATWCYTMYGFKRYYNHDK